MKLIFFDIDGTLVPFGGKILDSSLQSIEIAQSNGHKVFIATGRSKSQVSKKLLKIGFDGLVCATGGYVEYHDKVVYHKPFTREQMKAIVSCLTQSNSFFVEQARSKIFLTSLSAFGMTNNITGKRDSEVTLDQIMKRENSWGQINIDDNTSQYYKNHDRADSYCYCESKWNRSEFRSKLPKELKVLPPSFMPINDYAGEIMLERTSKMKGILKIAEELSVGVNDLYAFGDGDNDLEMLKGCGTGIAMANATKSCKAAADYITDDQHNDGIYKAMNKLGLV